MLGKLKEGLSRTRRGFATVIKEIVGGREKLDPEIIEDIRDVLISADVGVSAADELINTLRKRVEEGNVSAGDDVIGALREIIADFLKSDGADSFRKPDGKPGLMLLVGVNGVGKTTTAAKIAYRMNRGGKGTIVCAADTFRAAAIEQLEIWSEKAGSDFVKHSRGANPAAVVFDAISAAKAREKDWIIVDTAGRLHTKKNLMDELDKIKRVSAKNLEDAPHETLLVIDGTTGQNGLSQAATFGGCLTLSGVVVTKLDGTARGGAVLGIKKELGIPIRYVGVGEGIEDLLDFDPEAFAEALLSE